MLGGSEERRRFCRPRPPLTTQGPELLAILPHDRGGRLQPNADGAALVDKGAFGGDPPDDILGGQHRRHPTTSRDAAGSDLSPHSANQRRDLERASYSWRQDRNPLRRARPRSARRRVTRRFLAQQHCMGDACCDSRKDDTMTIADSRIRECR